ncbi:hypothetical protein EDD21DRAFT_373941 [Dissophora ornata]|nr:hypothetical protein EDD21DRAFT_373941 [Dissophora ornata]
MPDALDQLHHALPLSLGLMVFAFAKCIFVMFIDWPIFKRCKPHPPHGLPSIRACENCAFETTHIPNRIPESIRAIHSNVIGP